MQRLIGVIVLLLAQTAYATPSQELNDARAAFRSGGFQEAQALLTALLYPKARLSGTPELAEAHLLLGACHVEAGQPDQAAREFEEALLLDANLAMDPLVFSKDAVSLFHDKQRTLREHAEAEERRAEVAREKQRIRRILENMVVLEKRSYWVNFVPFGAGQFQNGQRGKGFFFLATQGVLGGVSAGLWSYQVLKYGFRGRVPPEDVGTVNTLQTLQLGSGLLFFGVALWGIADSLAHYEHVVSRTPEPGMLRELERLDAVPRRPTGASLTPLVTPDAVGLGARWDF